MLRESSSRPSIAVTLWGLAVVGVFVWRGDLRLDLSRGEPEPEPALAAAAEPAAPSSPAAIVGSAPRPVEPRSVVSVRRDPAAKAAPPHARRAGRVFDSMGFLLVGAEVSAVDGPTTRSDADGAFALDLPLERCSDLMVRAEGRRPQWARVSAMGPDPLVMLLEPAAPWDAAPVAPSPVAALCGEGTVLAPDGQPLAAAFVGAADSDCWAVSDVTGRFCLPMPTTAVRLCAQATEVRGEDGLTGGGYAALTGVVEAPRANGRVPLASVTTAPAGSLRGTVRDPKGNPVGELPVRVVGNGLRRTVQTGPGGMFRLAGLLPGIYRIAPFASRGAVGKATEVRLDHEVVDCDLQLVAAPERQVRVADASGAPLAGAWVAVSLAGTRHGVAQTDSEGLVSLPVVARAHVRDASFEVRVGAEFTGCQVKRFDADADPMALVVAMR